MKQILLLALLLIGITVLPAQAQLAKNKMPVGVKFYEVPIVDPQSGVTNIYAFADVEGQYDIIDFNNLDTTLAAQKRRIVYDDKLKTWRLPLNSELTGIVDPKVGPLPEQFFELQSVRPSLRHRVE
jgi:hypothetical protein